MTLVLDAFAEIPVGVSANQRPAQLLTNGRLGTLIGKLAFSLSRKKTQKGYLS